MRVFIAVLVLIFSLQSFTKADDFRDFQIEEMSVGDSLLDYFSKDKIKEEINSEFSFKYKNNKFVKLGVGQTKEFPLFKKLLIYDELGITIKPNDKNYIIYGLTGEIHCNDNIEKCFSKKDEILNDLKNIFENNLTLSSWEEKHPIDPSGKSTVYGNKITTDKNDSIIAVTIYDMIDIYNDSVAVEIRNKEYSDFVTYEAYN